ncbi:MAG: peptidase M50, partial [Pseudomonadales bacterium]|nr:peptidase M50 [Pseudomonadales bacterium]
SPATARGEAAWFVFYSVASFMYRAFIMIVIAIFVATKFFFIGVLLAIWAVATVFVIPLIKHANWILTNPAVGRRRSRAVTTVAGTALSVVIVMFVFPAPLWTNAEGVIWLPENATVRAGTSCFVEELLVQPGEEVEPGTPLIQCSDQGLLADQRILKARERELEVRYVRELREDRFKAAITRLELDTVNANLARVNERIEELTVRSKVAGRLRIPMVEDLPGRFVKQGEILGYVFNPGPVVARVVVPQADVALVRNRTERVEVLVPGEAYTMFPGHIRREVPGASETLPSAALGTLGGGGIPVDPREPEGVTAFEKIFQFDIALPDEYRPDNFGGRVFVRIDHGREPIAVQLYWAVRQVFLNQFGV